MDKVGRMWTKVGKGGGRWLKVDENIRGATCTSDAIFPSWLGLDTFPVTMRFPFMEIKCSQSVV